MNKKISTLLVGAALTSAFSVNAAVGDPVKNAASGQLYQLHVTGTADGVLGLGTDGAINVTSATTANLGASLWCVAVTSENQGKNPIFDFTNKAVGAVLDVDVEGFKTWSTDANGNSYSTPAKVGGSTSGWKFSPTLNLQKDCYLASYINSDSVAVLATEGADVVIKISLATETAINAVDGLLKFTLVEAAHRDLTAVEFNTKLNTLDVATAIKLKFEKDYNNTKLLNPFSTNELLAEASTSAGYLNLKKKVGDKYAYLRVDTAYANTVGEKFLTFAFAKEGDAIAAADPIAKQYNFKMTYCPTNDSLYIRVEEARMKADDDNGFWKDVTATINATADNNWVKLQDLVKADESRIVTIGKTPINTHISFGIGGCTAVKTTKTTIADGVYLIRNAKTDKYLAIPLYNDTTWVNNAEKANTPEWVTLNELQELNHMPAYQWVILKNNLSDKYNVSPITATNREYANVSGNGQLNKNEGATYYYFSSVSSNDFAGDSLEFVPVDKKYYSDKYLGYKKLTEDEMITNKYTFNYWHPYSSDKYIAVVKDSTMTVLAGKTAFELASTNTERVYGYDIKNAVANGKDRIPGLAQLVRTMYQVTYDGAIFGNHDEAKENKYTVSKLNHVTDSVYFKENNCIVREEGKAASHYYAILEAATDGNILNFKAGVSDVDATASLKAQTLKETRTSAFFISPDNTPLYRRFNNDAAGIGENKDDSTDSLYFKESIRGEYLMDEANTNLQHSTVDYAGIWNKEKANGKLAFRVDTAWLKRGAGEVKPQYLVSAFRQVIEGEKVIPCTETTNKHITADGKVTDDPYQCVHATHVKTPAFIYGKYMVNYSDSAKANTADVNPYLFNTKAVSNSSYTRVGFVNAVQYGDSLYVLAGKYKGMTVDQLKNVGIEAIIADYEKNYKSFINNLRGDIHKNVTWSFRYVNPDLAAQAYVDGKEGENNSFLIESNVYKTNEVYQTVGNGTVAQAIAPKEAAAWLKMHNGCLVLTDTNSKFDAAKTGGDGALVFNAYQKTAAEDMVTSNDPTTVSEVSVIAGEGQVTIAGAAGKKVVITNILGQTIVSTVLTSDNETIAVPAGIVVVAVEGEAAVKAIVK